MANEARRIQPIGAKRGAYSKLDPQFVEIVDFFCSTEADAARLSDSSFPKKIPDKYAAIAWICRNQLGRRNLTPEQKRYLIGKQYEADGRSTVKTIWMRRTTMDEMRIDEKEMEKQYSFDILPRLKRPFPAYAGVILAKTSRRGPLEAFPRV